MQDFSIWVSFNDYIRYIDLYHTSVSIDPAPDPRKGAQLNCSSLIGGNLGDETEIGGVVAGEVGRGMVVEPDDAGDAGGAVIDEEFKEVGFALSADDDADRFGTGDEAAVKVEGKGVGDLGEGEEIGCQELDVSGGKRIHGSATAIDNSTVMNGRGGREIQFKNRVWTRQFEATCWAHHS